MAVSEFLVTTAVGAIAKLFGLTTDSAQELAERKSGLKGDDAIKWLATKLETDETFKLSIVAELARMQIDDIKDARDHDNDTTDKLSMLVMLSSPVLIFLLIGALAYMAANNVPQALAVPIATVIGGALNQFYQERQQIMNYVYGSAVGEKINFKNLIKK